MSWAKTCNAVLGIGEPNAAIVRDNCRDDRILSGVAHRTVDAPCEFLPYWSREVWWIFVGSLLQRRGIQPTKNSISSVDKGRPRYESV